MSSQPHAGIAGAEVGTGFWVMSMITPRRRTGSPGGLTLCGKHAIIVNGVMVGVLLEFRSMQLPMPTLHGHQQGYRNAVRTVCSVQSPILEFDRIVSDVLASKALAGCCLSSLGVVTELILSEDSITGYTY